MKNIILSFTASTLIMFAMLTACSNSAEKVENAEENLKDAQVDLDEANQAYILDIENYRTETSEKISANEKSIADFNLRIENEKKEAKEAYRKEITELEQKNTDMKKRMEDYKAEGKENWDKFKLEFNHDMEELGNAFKDLTTKNTK
jgi:hypothetical protein